MQPRTTLIMAAVALVLGAFVYFYEIRGGEARRESEEQGKRIFAGVEADDVSAIALETTDGQAARVERAEAGGWRVTAPVDFPGDDVALDGLATTLSQLAHEVKLDDPQPLPVYGLGEGAREVRFEAGGKTHQLALGNAAPVGSNTYVAAVGSDAVYTVPSFRVNSFSKSLDDLRDRRVLHFDRTLVQEVEVRWPEGHVTLVRSGSGDSSDAGESTGTQWRLREPVEVDADDEVVASLLSDLSFLRADGFVDEVLSDEAAGLAEPPLRLTLQLEAAPEVDDAAARTLRFALGQELEGARLARGEQKSLYRVARERLDDFPRRVVAYRFKEVADFNSGDAQRFELALRADDGTTRSVVGTRDGEAWSVEPPVQGGRAEGLVTALSRLAAKDIAADWMGDEELAGMDLAPPRATLRVLGSAAGEGDAEVLADVALGVADPQRGIAARRAGRDEIFLLEASVAEHLPLSWEAFESRFAALEEIVPDAGGDAAADNADAPAEANTSSEAP